MGHWLHQIHIVIGYIRYTKSLVTQDICTSGYMSLGPNGPMTLPTLHHGEL